MFLKYMDALDAPTTAQLLHKMSKDVVLYVKIENIILMMTDNALNYDIVVKLLMKDFPLIFQYFCVAYYIKPILQDIEKLYSISIVVEHISSITKYAYNYCYNLFF